MNIGYLTPWAIPHGIAVYAERLIRGLQGAVEPRVVGFELNDHGHADIEAEAVLEHLALSDLVHVQYSTALYDQPLLLDILKGLHEAHKKVVLTAHTDIPPDFQAAHVDHWIVHHMGGQTYRMDNITVIPIGITPYAGNTEPANVRSVCCLGRRGHPEEVEEALDRIGGGILSIVDGQEWLAENLLVEKILRSQVVVLNYKDGSDSSLSKYAALAVGLPRPIMVSGSSAFSHVHELPGVAVADDAVRLSICLDYTFGSYAQALNYVEDRMAVISARRLRQKDVLAAHLQIYQKILQETS